jgi:hypothetical protein
MISKKILGIVLILLAVLLSLTIIGTLPSILGGFLSLTTIFSENPDYYGLGGLEFNVALIAATFLCWKYGLKLVRNRKPNVLTRT